ncbi:hypothetical protein S40293_04500 [Stachybotrys chartarum IBT 40293]|nr:hypothetical protein S40293_04500 [Stachybotrys chartarum IBT 40293]
MPEAVTCSPQADDAFGPQVVACRQGFDFTLLFEQTILSAIPSGLMLLASTLFLLRRYRRIVKTRRRATRSLKWAKQVTSRTLHNDNHLVLVVLWSLPGSNPTRASLPAMVISFVGTCAIALLSYVEHDRSVRPSSLLCVYLLLSALLDLSQVRTLWLREHSSPTASVFTAALAFKILVLVAEMVEKRPFLEAPYRDYPPEALGGILNRSVFWWLNSLLRSGSSKELSLDDLFDLDEDLTTKILHEKFRRAWTLSKRRRWSLFWISISCAWRPLAAALFSRLLVIGFRFSQPLLIHRAVSLLEEPSDQARTNNGRALIGATALIYLGIAISTGHFKHNTYRFLTMLRGGIISLIYDSTLHLDASEARDSVALTMMSTDIDRIVQGFELWDALWAGPIEVGIATDDLTVFVGTCLSLGKMSASSQKSWIEAVQRRVAATASALTNMKGVKMTGLAKVFDVELSNLRSSELRISRRYRWILSVSATFSNMSVPAISALTIAVYVAISRYNTTGLVFDSAFAFTMISLISLLAHPVQAMSFAIPYMAAGISCFDRIQNYLESPASGGTRRSWSSESLTSGHGIELRHMPSISTASTPKVMVSVRNATFTFKSALQPVLKDISIDIEVNNWSIILGPVGSGKSALLLALLGEIDATTGVVEKDGSMQTAFCSQDPWLPNKTIRQCIIGQSEFDHHWYSAVLDACDLMRDLPTMPAGENTVVGSNGAGLSGGQKQRISLARALYSRRRLLLLDDVLTGLDTKTEQWVMDRVFGSTGLIRQAGMTVVLATHSARHAYKADQVIILSAHGNILEQGAPGNIASIETKVQDLSDVKSTAQSSDTANIMTANSDDLGREMRADLSRQVGDTRLYGYYFKSLGWTNVTCVAVANCIYAFNLKFPTVWLQWWSHAETTNPGSRTSYYLGIYGLFSALCLVAYWTELILLLHVGMPRSSYKLHKTLLSTVLAAPHWFFVSTDSGQILNRFSQDLALIDLQLPIALIDTIYLVATCLMEAALIASSSRWIAVMYPAIILVLYVLQKFYLRTSRQLRLIEIEAKSPVYSQFSETLRGLSTIRAFGWQQDFVKQTYGFMDDSQKPFYLLFAIQRWLSFVLDCLVAVMAVVVMSLATQLDGSSAGSLGIALVNILSFSQGLTNLLRSWVDMETSLGAVARIRKFQLDTPSEALPEEQDFPDESWPSKGTIQVQDLVASYQANTNPVLRALSVEIRHGQNIGICGRTGSGKSSFILALLKVIEIESGEISIDSLSMQHMPRDIVRRRLTVMPQDPLLLPGTLRFNVDPWSEHSDQAVESALRDVGLWEIAAERGLETEMVACPLSRGQQQLFCLARALLGKSQVLILDEATSTLDATTEAKIMDIVGSKFADKTVIVIAHHLHTIRNFDRVMVLDKGNLAEWGTPDGLLEQKGIFHELWQSQH